MRIPGWIALGIGVGFVCCGLSTMRADEVDDVVAEQMRAKQIPGLSLAIVLDGKLVRAHGYGFADDRRKDDKGGIEEIMKAIAKKYAWPSEVDYANPCNGSTPTLPQSSASGSWLRDKSNVAEGKISRSRSRFLK